MDFTLEQIAQIDIGNVEKNTRVNQLLQRLHLPPKQLAEVAAIFEEEMDLALADKPSSLQMENTYVPELPNGRETGKYLALDLGGTNFRVLLLELQNGVGVSEEVEHFVISDEIRLGEGRALFDRLAECLESFLKRLGMQHERLALGFTFSFPMHHRGIDSGTLVTWTKSFNCANVEGECAVRLLREAIGRRGLPVDVVAIVNDTTGTLMQGALVEPRTRIGMILGTGSNACYMEQADRVKHWETQHDKVEHVCVDIEWGAFGDNGRIDFIKTPYDVEVDKESLLRGSFTFEKYISGKYLGELFRVICWHLMQEKLLFADATPSKFPSKWTFPTSNISMMEQDNIDDTTHLTCSILRDLGYKELEITQADVAILKHVAALVSSRASHLVAVLLSVILKRIGNTEEIVIAVDGSLYRHHPRLQMWIARHLTHLAPKNPFKLNIALDGSGKGAALVAAIADRLASA
uniref:Phosphotransferase n=1 Tax=Nyssomyia neivai TaxID=330878 RepID=A0A1L8E278_9DIPT